MYNKIFFLLLLTGYCCCGWAQPSVHFRYQHIDGLSQNTVFRIYQDRQGFLWVGTGDGLNRYDGTGFKVYKPSPANKPGYITGRVIRNKIFEDESGRLWLSTENGIQYLDKKTNRFHFIVPMNDTANYLDGSLFPVVMTAGQCWFGKLTKGIFSYDPVTKECKAYPFPGNKEQRLQYTSEKSLYDQKGNIWITEPNGLLRFNIHTKTWTVFFNGRKLSDLCLVNGLLYLVADDAIILFDASHQTYREITKGYTGKSIRCIAKDNYNNAWAGDVEGNILKIDVLHDSIIKAGNINSNNRNVFPVYELYFDRSDILWIGTDGMGLLKADIHPPDFNTIPNDNTPEKDKVFVKSIYEDEKGVIWLGTFGKGILLFDKKAVALTPMNMRSFKKQTVTTDMVSFITEDRHKNMWIGYGERLFARKYGTDQWMEVNIPYTGSKDRLRVTGMQPFNDHWIITTTLACYDLYADPSLSSIQLVLNYWLGDFSFLYERKDHTFISGYKEGGLYKSVPMNDTIINHKYLVDKTGFKCMWADSARNLLWFGSDKGLMAYNPDKETYRFYTEEDGIGNGFIYGILDAGGALWLSTNGGLSQVVFNGLHSDGFPAIRCRNFTKNDGLQGDEYNSGAYLKGKDGTLYFGGINGLNWFRPEAITRNKKIEQLAITRFTVNNIEADSTLSSEYIRHLELGHTQNNLYLQFRALEFSSPATINYAYQLEGWDHDWVYSKTNNEVRYNNLPPGNYVFYVKAFYNEAGKVMEPYSITIHIAPPFWKTWWFVSISILLVASAIVWFTKASAQRKLKKKIEKLEQQRALELERMRISQEMHDDIGAGLTQISLISDAATFHSRSGSAIQQELQDIAATSRQLVDNIGEIIWSLNPQHDTLDILMSHLREQLHNLVQYAPINYTIDFPAITGHISLNNQLRRNILLVTKEIVHNAVKYSRADNLLINASIKENQLEFDITDDGAGFDTSIPSGGNGLRNIRKRISESGGQLSIESAPGTGTRFRYSFPLA